MSGATPPPPLPPRIWVVGPCGSGKSTVAARLARAQGFEATHLDDIHWKPGWIESTPEEERAVLEGVLARPAWVVDGNYSALRGPWMDEVQLFVWLDLPLNVTLPRLLQRCAVRSLKGVSCCNGNYESLWRTFFDKESILLWAVSTHQRRKRQLAADLAGRPHVHLRSPRAIEAWVKRAVSRGRAESCYAGSDALNGQSLRAGNDVPDRAQSPSW